jgi:23S rRNA (adenine1618-N6)-methyltransferase
MKNSANSSPFHPRNRHQGRYDFAALTAAHPPLAGKVRPNGYGELSVDFADPEAVMLLNQALLKLFYNLNWQLPKGYLTPPVPGRADYVHALADLLASDTGGVIPRDLDVMDIGCGANCIYPLIGNAEYGWRFTGTDITAEAITAAGQIVASNPGLQRGVRLRRQKDAAAIFAGVVHKNERYHAVLCNPPFHSSAEEAATVGQRKTRNLGLGKNAPLNFGGHHSELWCDGGERKFVGQMIEESVAYSDTIIWFTSLVSRKENLPALRDQLRDLDAYDVRIIEMAQGQKQSRFIAWTFQPPATRAKRLKR